MKTNDGGTLYEPSPNRAAWPQRWKEAFEERAGIIEYMAGLTRQTAEFRAEQDVRKQAAMEPRKERVTA